MKNYLILLSLLSFLISDYELDIFRESYDVKPSMKLYYGDASSNVGKVKKITGNDEDGYAVTLLIYKNDTGFGKKTADIPEITSDMMFKVSNNKLFVDLEGTEEIKLRKEEERLAKIKAEALPLFIERINDFDSGRIKFKHITTMGMGRSNYREFTFRVKYLDFERNVDVPFEGITEKSNRVKFSFDYIECNLDRASKDTKFWKGTNLHLMNMNFVANVGDKWNQWYTVNKEGESNIDLIEGREYIVYLRLNDEQLNELDQGIKNGIFKEFSLLHSAGLSRREFYIHSLIK